MALKNKRRKPMLIESDADEPAAKRPRDSAGNESVEPSNSPETVQNDKTDIITDPAESDTAGPPTSAAAFLDIEAEDDDDVDANEPLHTDNAEKETDGEDENSGDEDDDEEPNAAKGDDGSHDSDSSDHSAHSNTVKKKSAPAPVMKQSKLKARNEPAGWGYSGKLTKRILSIRGFADPGAHTFSIDNLPQNLEWVAVSSPAQKKFYALGVRGSHLPAKIWFIGTLVDTYFFNLNNGDPAAQVNVNVRMLEDADTNKANAIIKRFTTDRGGVTHYDDVRFARWMTIRRPGETRTVAETFSDVYNATKGLKLPRTKMSFMPPEDLKNGDLVLVEAQVRRYHKNKTVQSEWVATYHMNWLALLHDKLPAGAVASTSTEPEVWL